MIRRCTLLVLIAFSVSQETYVSPQYTTSNNSFRFNYRKSVDSDSPGSNLWLISRGDPIPESLSQQIANGRVPNVGTNGYGLRLSSRSSEGSTIDVPMQQQSSIAYDPQAPLYYDRIVTSEDRRQNIDNYRVINHDADTILVELPLDITEGLWVTPESQIPLQQQSVSGRQTIDGESVNIKFDTELNSETQDGIPTAVLPKREFTSRLPNSGIQPQDQLGVSQQRYYEISRPTFSSIQDATAINASTSSLDRSVPRDREIWLVNNDQRSDNQEYKNFTPELFDIPTTNTTERARNIQEYGVLTSEDIELLERLGILSALIIEPVHQENTTFNANEVDHPQREFESEPVLIDHGGQSYFSNTERQDISSLRDVVLIDIPQFTTSDYHTNLPENAGGEEIQKIPLPANLPESRVQLNDTPHFSYDTNLTDRQIFEILQLLSINSGDFFNLSTAAPVTKPNDISSLNNSISNVPEQTYNSSIPSNTTKESLERQSYFSTNSSLASAGSASESQTTISKQTDVPPSVSNGRIQPRLLDQLTKNDNEIIERLFEKSTPMSDRKLEILKKLDDLPKPYIFGFKQDDGNGTFQHRDEKADSSGIVRGTYGYRDALGVYRNVSYIADNNGFHAVVKTNEPGTVSHNTADAVYMSQTPPLAALVKMMAYRRSKEVPSAIKLP